MTATALVLHGSTVLADDTELEPAAGVVSVRLLGWANSSAGCSCGWSGNRRLLRAAAAQDAWLHAVRDGCDVACPLMLSW